MKSVSVIIPTVNEGATIAKVIKDVKSHLSYDFEILVVDYKSSDKTAEIANANGARAINVDEKGKGRAVKKGAEKASGEVVVVLDGDASFSAEKIDEIVGPVFNNEKDIVYGSRFLPGSKREMSFIRFLGNKLFIWLAKLLYGMPADFLTGIFAINKKTFFELAPTGNHFDLETELFGKAMKESKKLAQVPISYKKSNKSNLNPLKDGFRIFTVLISNKYVNG